MLKTYRTLLAGLLLPAFIFVMPAFAQHQMGSGQMMHRQMMNMNGMMDQMDRMMMHSDSMLTYMQENQSGYHNPHWMHMVQGTDSLVRNMHHLTKQMQEMMENDTVMMNGQNKEHLESMKQHLGNMIKSMNAFMGSMESAENMQKSNASNK